MLTSEYELARCLAYEYVRTQGTVRSVGRKFCISKTNVHRLISEFIISAKKEDLELAVKAKMLILKNKSERHFRGGNATKAKFEKMKQ